MKNSPFCCLMLFFISGTSAAGHLASVQFLGFSDDGMFAAMEEYWISDGSGTPGAELVIKSVPADSVIHRYSILWPEELLFVDGLEKTFLNSDNPARDSIRELSQAILDSLGINPANSGVHCIHHPLTDRDAVPDRVSFVTWLGASSYMGPEYNLQLRNHPEVPESSPQWLTMFDCPVLLEVIITDQSGDMVMFHMDSSPEPGYEYVSEYRIRDVYVERDSLLVIILNTVEPGFEGADGRFRMITGVLR